MSSTYFVFRRMFEDTSKSPLNKFIVEKILRFCKKIIKILLSLQLFLQVALVTQSQIKDVGPDNMGIVQEKLNLPSQFIRQK